MSHLRRSSLVIITLALAACGSQQTSSPPSSSSGSSASVGGPSSSANTAPAKQTCTDNNVGKNSASPDFYQQQYDDGLAKSLKQKLSIYDSSVEAGDPQEIGTAAGDLYSEVKIDADMANNPVLFGCYDPSILTGLQQAADAFAKTIDNLSCAGANKCGHTPSEIPGLVAEAKPEEKTYIEAINAYADQFNGEQMPQ